MGCMKEKGEEQVCPLCGMSDADLGEVAPMFLRPGSQLKDRYIVGIALGQGGFGITYIGYDKVLNTRVAIKEYFPSDIAGRTSEAGTVSAYTRSADDFGRGKERFLDEARTLAKFSDHPCIVGVKDCFAENETAYMIMEYLDGVSLKEYLNRKGGRLSVSDSISILAPVMDALCAVHKEGIIHRDISPDNIFITTDGRVRLIDFGAARQTMGGQKSLSVMLKPGYAPEEQYRTRGNQGPWTDVYALTATLYRMITGEVPPDSLERVMEDTLDIPADLPQNVQTALRIGMAVRASERYSSVEQLQAALNGQPPLYSNKITSNTIQVQNSDKIDKVKKSNKILSILVVACVTLSVAVVLCVFAIGRYSGDVQEVAVANQKNESQIENSNLTDENKNGVSDNKKTTVQQNKEVDSQPNNQTQQGSTSNDNKIYKSDNQLIDEAVYKCYYGYVYSINTGDTSDVSDYIDINSPYYDKEIKQMKRLYGQGIKEEVLNYNIISKEKVNSTDYNVKQHSVIRVYYKDGTSKDVDETYTFLIRKVNGRFVYVKMYE